ncbi:MAG: TonB-dependent receptor [Acidobacteria bacterium]|nr:TonB-dependent receptor [Acidobacteriota bacterium]
MRVLRILSVLIVGLGLTLVTATTLRAQTTGTIYGQVSDPSGAAVPEANITVENTGTGLVRKAVSTSVGSYLVPSLPPGAYKVTVEHSGFTTYAQTGITVIVGENARVDAELKVGAMTQRVEVSASAVRVDTQSSTVGATVDDRRIQDMPLNGRNVLALTQLLPGVGIATFETVTTTARGGPTVTVSGSRANQNNIELDGTSMVEQMYNLGINLPSPDAIEEFRVLTNTYDAQYGRASGSVLLGVTKSGTNKFHGALFEYLRNDAIDGRNFFSSIRPKLRQNQFGGSIGGPVLLPGYNGRDRTFFFFSYQGTRIAQEGLVTNFPPTAQERQGIFATPITDPTTGLPFPNNTIPPDRFDPMAKSIMDIYIPLPNRPDGRSVVLNPLPISANQYTLRADHQINSANRLKFRWFRDKSKSKIDAGDVLGVGVNASNLVDTESLSLTTVFNPGLLNEAMFSHLRVYPLWGPLSDKAPKDLGGNFNFDGPYRLGPAAFVVGRFAFFPFLYFGEPETTFQINDNLTWMHGRHTIKVGAQVQVLRHATFAQFSSGFFTFVPAFTGDALADYLIGRPINFFEQSYLVDDSRGRNYHGYVQDDIKISPRLTLNFGLRYELIVPWWQQYDHHAVYRAGQQSTVFPTAPPSLVFPGDAGIPRGLVPTDKNDFAPRIGFAWDPTGKGRTSIRAAYGVFSEYTGAIYSSNVNQTQPFNVAFSIVPPSFSDPWAGTPDPFPYFINLENPIFTGPVQAFTISPDFRNGYIQQFNLNFQRQFGENLVLQAGYVGKIGRRLSGQHEKNQAVFGPGATIANVQERRPIQPDFFASLSETTSDHNSWYHSFQANLEKRFARGYTFQVAYTFSKSIDDRSFFAVDNPSDVQDGNNYLNGQRGLSDFDQRHIFAVNFIWEIPFMKRNPVLGGWQFSDITRIGSGTPFSAYSGSDIALVGSGRGTGSQRANLIGNPGLDPNRPRGELINQYFNTAAFALPETGQFGNSGRNIMIGPGFSQTDFALQKRFELPGERGRFEFRADFFNLFNQVNFGNPDNTFLSPAFGRILSARDGRIIQLALRYDF